MIFLWLFLFSACSKGLVDVEVFAAEIHKLLFGHSKVGGIFFKFIVNLNLSMLLDDVTESKDKVFLVLLALQQINGAWFGVKS